MRMDPNNAKWRSRAGPPRGIIDAPIFLPGDQAHPVQRTACPTGVAPTWVDRLFGITVASAHAMIPSEWWSVPVGGGTPTQLTHVYAFALFAALSPDGRYIASYSSDGIFVMKPDGTALTSIVDAGARHPRNGAVGFRRYVQVSIRF